MRQIELSRGNKRKICWVDVPDRVRVGWSITLKGVEGWWTIEAIHNTIIDKMEINRSWHCGGL